MYALLVFFGWLSIYSASSGEDPGSIFDFSQRYGKQMMWIGMAIVLAMIILIIDAEFFSATSFFIYLLMIALLIGVLMFGKTVAGSKSWFQIGSFAIQPSEFTKFATALALAKYLSTLDIDIQKMRTKIIASAIVLLPAFLILLQNDTGSALVYSAFVIVLFREGLSGTIIIVAAFYSYLTIPACHYHF